MILVGFSLIWILFYPPHNIVQPPHILSLQVPWCMSCPTMAPGVSLNATWRRWCCHWWLPVLRAERGNATWWCLPTMMWWTGMKNILLRWERSTHKVSTQQKQACIWVDAFRVFDYQLQQSEPMSPLQLFTAPNCIDSSSTSRTETWPNLCWRRGDWKRFDWE